MKNDIVTIKCYGSTVSYKRQDAIKEFTIATNVCEGHERERYGYILSCLLSGDTYIDDSDI